MPKKPLAPGLQRLKNSVQRGADSDDTANDLTLRPRWKPPTSNPVAAAGAGFQANSTSGKLAAWADTLSVPPHSPAAAFAPGLRRLQGTVDQASPLGPEGSAQRERQMQQADELYRRQGNTGWGPGDADYDPDHGRRRIRDMIESNQPLAPEGSPKRQRQMQQADAAYKAQGITGWKPGDGDYEGPAARVTLARRQARASQVQASPAKGAPPPPAFERDPGENTSHFGPLALDSVGRTRLDQAMQDRNAGAGQAHAPVLSPEQARAFETANQHYEQAHMQSHAPNQSQGAPRKGWGPAARIGSYNARHPGGANAPYGGDPTQAPDYVEPKGKSGK